MKPIVKFYQALLEDVGCTIEKDGGVHYPNEKGDLAPLKVKVRRGRGTVSPTPMSG